VAVLSIPLSEWPRLICGPILRRVERRKVSAFVAFKEAGTVQLTLYKKPKPTVPSDKILASPARPTVALGKNLHASMALLTLPADLQPGTNYGYDITFKPTGGTALNLKGLNMLSAFMPLGYEVGALPSFALPPGLKDLHVLHGSCRKPHGDAQNGMVRDALAIADDIIRDTRADALKRPHQLILSGDQIYADDVALSLMATLRSTANDLLGWSQPETLPRQTPQGTVTPSDADVEPGPKRAEFIRTQTAFTSGAVQGHLMFLGEFYAMYLLAFSDALWPRSAGPMPPGPGPPFMPNLPRAADFAPGASAAEQSKIDAERQTLLPFAITAPAVRRALANVSTYMLIDDHEVTDDWYLHKDWVKAFRASPTSRQIVRNALIAYSVFQDWGNDPESYEPPIAHPLLAAITFKPATGLPGIQANPNLLDALLDVGPQIVPVSQRLRWNYAVTDAPEHVIIALDTRTRRAFPAGNGRQNAALMSDIAMGEALDALRPNPPASKLAFVISPSPVSGNPGAEAAQRDKVLKDPKAGAEDLDNEAWSGHRAAYEDMLSRLAAFERVVVLSGDVHHSFTNHIAYFRDGEPLPPGSRIVQLCVSAFKNQDSNTLMAQDVGWLKEPGIGWLGFTEALGPQAAASVRSVMHQAALALTGTQAQAVVGLLFSQQAAERFEKPAVIPSNGWTTAQAVQTVQTLAEPLGVSATQWRYFISYVRDARDANTRESDVPGLKAVLDPSGTAKLHPATRRTLLDLGRDVVGIPNLGQIKITVAAAPPAPDQLIHRLFWHPVDPGGKELTQVVGGETRFIYMFTEHKAPLTTPPASERPTVKP
jgi:hypothetical protein